MIQDKIMSWIYFLKSKPQKKFTFFYRTEMGYDPFNMTTEAFSWSFSTKAIRII